MYEPYEIIDNTVKCPYNLNHTIARSRIQRHIVKCEKQYPEDYKVICPYNATHRLFKSEVTDHIITCPMRRLIDPELYQWTRKHGSIRTNLQSDIVSTIECEDSFEQEFKNEFQSNMNNNHDVEECINSIEVHNMNLSNLENKNLRPPRGFSEAVLTYQNDDVKSEDMESVISSMGMGRGKFNSSRIDMLKAVGLGQGKPFNR